LASREFSPGRPGRDLIERIASLSHELVPIVEVDRAKNLLADLEQESVSARQAWHVSSARLKQVLRINPRAVVIPLEHNHLQDTLMDPARSLPDLHVIALTNRPELGSYQAMVEAAVQRIRREKGRMLLPTVLIDGFQTPHEMIQGGIFGLGVNNNQNQWVGSDDVSLQHVWELDALGIGNLARIKEQHGEQSKAIIDFFRTQDMIASDVTQAQANLQSAAVWVAQADRGLRTGIAIFNGCFEGLQDTTRMGDVLVLINRPQEVVFALQLLKGSFDNYFTTVAEYNPAQFELFHALGYPAREITYVNSPGTVEPVDTTRPDYLPPVGNGPPPATR
jgi:hypothetical protein